MRGIATPSPALCEERGRARNDSNMHQIKIEKFEGPLDLLLQLIEQQQLDITQVALSQVTDQYLEFLRGMEERRPEELADFLMVAAKLLVMKSKALLPFLVWGEEEGGEDLEIQLRMYKAFIEASQIINNLIRKKNFSFFREKSVLFQEVIFSPPKKLTPEQLANFFRQVLGRLEPIINLPQRALAKTISIKERIEKIRNLILNKNWFDFNELLDGQTNKTDIIINFLALLELIKQREVVVDQNDLFQKMMIKKF